MMYIILHLLSRGRLFRDLDTSNLVKEVSNTLCIIPKG